MKLDVSIKLHISQAEAVLGSHKITYSYTTPSRINLQDKTTAGRALLKMCARGLAMFAARSKTLVMHQSSSTKLQEGAADELAHSMTHVLPGLLARQSMCSKRLMREHFITGWQHDLNDIVVTWGSHTCFDNDIPFDMKSPALALSHTRGDGLHVRVQMSTVSADRNAMPVRTFVVSDTNKARLLWHQRSALQKLPSNVSYRCRRAMVKQMHLQSLFYLFADKRCYDADTESFFDAGTGHIIVRSKNPLGVSGAVYSISAQV